ncbi:MAG: calcium/proton exchanger [Nitrospiraceae bacterium]
MTLLTGSWLDWMLVMVPAAIAAELLHWDPLLVFVFAALGIVPLAGVLGKATEDLSSHFGEGIGGLLNASLGNLAEMIIAIFALRAGLHDVVKASITGSILGNILLVLGASMAVGGYYHERQRFNQTAAGMGASLLLLSAVGLIVPALFHFSAGEQAASVERNVSLDISVVLFAIYVLSLFFSLKTHRHLYVGGGHHEEGHVPSPSSIMKPSIMLGVATLFIALLSEFLVGAIQPAAERMGFTQVFVGVILVAIIGNAAEHSTAVLVASKNKMDLALGIAVGSSIQIALFVAPVLVFLSYAFGKPLDLIFTPFEVAAVTISVFAVNFVAVDGESHWMEGVLLVAVYVILGIAFYFLPG